MEPPEHDDAQAWLVFADWLQAQVEPHQRALGEAIVLANAPGDSRRHAQIDALTEQHRAAWIGELADIHGLQLTGWQGGFPREAEIAVSGEGASATLVALLGHVMGSRIEILNVGMCEDDDATLVAFFTWFARRRYPLRSLAIRNQASFGGPYRTHPMAMGDVSGVWRCPLEQLTLESDLGMQLGIVAAPSLQTLDLGVLGREATRALANAALPKLARLRLALGPSRLNDDPRWIDVVTALPAIVDPQRTPMLRSLALSTGHALIEPILDQIARLTSLGRLDELDLAGLRIGDDDLATLEDCREACAGVARVRLTSRYVRNKRAMPRLGKTCVIV